jgi:hypothetical protein
VMLLLQLRDGIGELSGMVSKGAGNERRGGTESPVVRWGCEFVDFQA